MELWVKSQTANTITLQWTPEPGAIGYRFKSSSMDKFSFTWDATRTTVKFSKADYYEVEAVMPGQRKKHPPVVTPPPVEPPPPDPTIPAPLWTDGFQNRNINAWLGGAGGRNASCDCIRTCPGGTPDTNDPLDRWVPNGSSYSWQVQLRPECKSLIASCLNACELGKQWPDYALGVTRYWGHSVTILEPYVPQVDFCLVSEFAYPMVKYGGLGISANGDNLALFANLGFAGKSTDGHYANPNAYTIWRGAPHPATPGKTHDYIVKETGSMRYGTDAISPKPGEIVVFYRIGGVGHAWTTLWDSRQLYPGGVPTRQWGYGIGNDTTMLVDNRGHNVADGTPRKVGRKFGAYRGRGNENVFGVAHHKVCEAETFESAEAYLNKV